MHMYMCVYEGRSEVDECLTQASFIYLKNDVTIAFFTYVCDFTIFEIKALLEH